MKYLLDTHIWLWSFFEPENLDSHIIETLEDEENEIFISPITVWETMILAAKGKIELKPSPEEWIQDALRFSPVKEATLTHQIAMRSRSIQLPHQDPADRFIAATALEYGMILITVDKYLLRSEEIEAFLFQ